MKKLKLEKQFLEELTKVPNISIACERLTLSRQTVYRWMGEDMHFKEAVELALTQGVESINDLAESKLITNIKSGNQRSIEYWLANNKKMYHKPKPVQVIEQKKTILGKREMEFDLNPKNERTNYEIVATAKGKSRTTCGKSKD